MKNDISIVAIAISVVAIAVAGFSIVTQETTDTSDFVLVSDQKEFVTTVTDLLDGIQEPCYQDPDCIQYFARKFVTESQVNLVINDIVSVQDQHQIEIITNRDNFKDNHPFDFEPEDFDDPPIEGEQISPLVGVGHQITIELEKTEWLKGELVSISGNARVAQGQVQLTITQPDGDVRSLNAIVTDEGKYQIFFGTDFKLSPLGEYTVFVQQRNSTSETISFILVE